MNGKESVTVETLLSHQVKLLVCRKISLLRKITRRQWKRRTINEGGDCFIILPPATKRVSRILSTGAGRGVGGVGECVAGGHARWGACMAGGYACRGHAWQGGACMVHMPPARYYEMRSVNVRAVRILLECILVVLGIHLNHKDNIRIMEAFSLPWPILFCTVQRDVASLPSYNKLNSNSNSYKVM